MRIETLKSYGFTLSMVGKKIPELILTQNHDDRRRKVFVSDSSGGLCQLSLCETAA